MAAEQPGGRDAVAAQVVQGPAAKDRRARTVWGWWRHMNPSTTIRPPASAASKQRAASAGLVANGFSHSTCLPAWRAPTVQWVCSDTGRAT
jgi:hypothetical protein